MTTSKCSIVLFCLFLLLSNAALGQFRVSIIGTDGASTDTLTLGTDAAATNGIDRSLGEKELPPLPPSSFDLRSVNFSNFPGDHGLGLKKDLRPFIYDYQRDTFKVTWLAGPGTTTGGDLELTWPAGLSDTGGGYWKLIDQLGGVFVNLDMTLSTSYEVPPVLEGIGFYIIHGDTSTWTTVTNQRVCGETDDKGKWGKPTKANKRTPWVLPNVHLLGTQLNKDPGFKITGLMQVGSDPVKSVVIKKYADLLKSAFDPKTSATHTGPPTCLDSAYNKKLKNYALPGDIDPITLKTVKRPHPVPITKQLKGMSPALLKGAQNNELFAQLMVAKLNVALNTAHITPPFTPTVRHPALDQLFIRGSYSNGFLKYDGKTVAQLITDADKYISCDSVDALVTGVTLAELRTMLRNFNEAFTKAGPDTGIYITSAARFDTATYWANPPKGTKVALYQVKGNRSITEVPFLEHSWGAGAGSATVSKLLSRSNHPYEYSLEQNYPNPFNPTTVISFNLIENGFVSVRVFNILGQEIATLAAHEEMAAGENQVEFAADDYPSGVYFYRVEIADEYGAMKFQATRKMVLTK